MVNCFVPECYHRSDGEGCSPCTTFKLFPNDTKLRQKWIQLVRRKDREPYRTSVVCSCHFLNGDTNRLPSIFPWNKSKGFHFVSPEKRTRSRKDAGKVLNSENIQSWTETNLEIPDVRLSTDDVLSDRLFDNVQQDYSSEQLQNNMELFNTSLQQHCSQCSISEDLVKQLTNENKALKDENMALKDENKAFKEELEILRKMKFIFERIVENEELFKHYTGLSPKVLKILGKLLLEISENCKWTSVRVLLHTDQLLLTLTKLRQNLSHQDLAFRFGVSVSTVQLVFTKTLRVLHQVLFTQFMGTIPSRTKNQMFIPKCFKPFPNARIVIDCTEITCDIPKNMAQQKAIYSGYKERCTAKFLICCAPNGCVTYCSSAYPGSTSDRAIV